MSVTGRSSKLSYPSRTLFAVAAVMVSSVWVLAGFYDQEERFRRVNTDPFHIGSQLDRFREAAKVQGGGGKKAWVSEEVYAAFSEAAKRLRRGDRV